jgi:RNA polymerase sigma-70 factor (ECF subfamily)
VVHDVFLGLPDALRRYDERGSLDAWLRRVTARVALTRLRSARRRRETGVEDADRAAHAAGANASADAGTATDIAQAIEALPDGLRAVFVLRAVEGYGHAEIARLLDISPGASEVRFHRAVRRMRALLGGAP